MNNINKKYGSEKIISEEDDSIDVNDLEDFQEILTFENKDYDGYIMDKFISLLHIIFKKNIEVEIDFKDVKSFADLGEEHSEYIQLFYLYINIIGNFSN